jgi:hypothetical protein
MKIAMVKQLPINPKMVQIIHITAGISDSFISHQLMSQE